MVTFRTLFHGTSVRSHRFLLTVGTIAVGLGLVGQASASLIGDSIEYDGHVKSGASTGVEQHFVAPAFPPATFTLPVTNGPLAAPLQPAHALSGSETEFLDSLNSQTVQHVVITIQATNGATSTFVNPLDPGIPLPVLFDGFFHSNSLAAGQKLVVQQIGIENLAGALPPFPAPGSSTITGLGTVASPLHVQLGIAASQVTGFIGAGALKVHLYYTTMPNVPEPATWAMLLTGVVGLVGMLVRGHRLYGTRAHDVHCATVRRRQRYRAQLAIASG